MTCFDYTNQAWVIDGIYVRCGHPESMACTCYGKVHAGEQLNGIEMNRVLRENGEMCQVVA